ncbi:MAG TPA: DUF72 domain-containing protein [Clostridiaceae bacterium]|nr:DUF72 domain-containing protein [Clostridiaceae bacterium]
MICIGTAGYSYEDWVGPFYPEGTKSSQMLEYYASCFNFVEINSTYYHMPGLRLFDSLNRKTSNDFKLSVKLFKGFTHEGTGSREEAKKFIFSLEPVIKSNKLMCILAQFPYSFNYRPENMDLIKMLREWFPEIDLSVEFRNHNWIRQEVMQLLKSENLGFVCVDEPGIKGLVKNVTAVTSDIAYLRLHGRNAGKWYGSEGNERYNYLYSWDELYEWVPRIKEMEKRAKFMVISFNNHPLGKAVQNARMMAEMLK